MDFENVFPMLQTMNHATLNTKHFFSRKNGGSHATINQHTKINTDEKKKKNN